LKTNKIFSKKYRKLKLNSFNMAESEETGMEFQVSKEESDDDSSFEVIEDPKNPQVSTYRVLPERIYNPITAMGFSAMFTFQLDNTKR
jgi:hypothetical protein